MFEFRISRNELKTWINQVSGPRPRAYLKLASQRLQDRVLQQYKNVTENWKERPIFEVEKLTGSAYGFQIVTDSRVFYWWDITGARPHEIHPTGYTTTGSISRMIRSRGKRRAGQFVRPSKLKLRWFVHTSRSEEFMETHPEGFAVFASMVHHPGFAPSRFSEKLLRRIDDIAISAIEDAYFDALME